MKKLFQYITIFVFTLFVTITVTTALGSTVVLTMDSGSQGSGFFIAPDLIATSYSVIKGTSRGYASETPPHEKNYPIVGIAAADEYDDLVILKVSGAQRTPLPIGDSALVKKGDTISIVHPLEPTDNLPMISAIEIETTVREIRESPFIFEGKRTVDEFLINTPNVLARGGEPVLNDKGKVIGVFKRTDPDEENFKQNIRAVVASENLNQLMDNMRTKDSQTFPRPLSADGVSGTHLTWGPGYYEFTLWNHRDETLYDPQCVIIFKDENGEVICADPFTWGGLMFAGGGARVSRNFFSSADDDSREYFYDPTSKPYPPGHYFTESLVGPRVKEIVYSYEVRIIDLAIDTRYPSRNNSLIGFTGSGLTWFEMSKFSQVDGIEHFGGPLGRSNRKFEDSPQEVGFSYSVQNNLSTDITNVRLTLVFYDKEGVPIDQWDINNAVDILAKQTLKAKGRVSRSTKQLTKSVEPRIFPYPFE